MSVGSMRSLASMASPNSNMGSNSRSSAANSLSILAGPERKRLSSYRRRDSSPSNTSDDWIDSEDGAHLAIGPIPLARKPLEDHEQPYTEMKYWSCSNVNRWEDLFCENDQTTGESFTSWCVLCGYVFLEPAQNDVRWHHMDFTHNLGQCSETKTFLPSDYFQQHLACSHNVTFGHWTKLQSFATNLEALRKRRRSTLETHVPSKKRPYQCLFAPYGCPAEFGGKHEWEKHVNVTHMQMRPPHCVVCRMKLETYSVKSHLRTAHCIEDEKELAQSARGCFGRWPPDWCKCFFCTKEFNSIGEGDWDLFLTHIGDHMVGTLSDQLPGPEDWIIDRKLETYFAAEGLIVRNGESWTAALPTEVSRQQDKGDPALTAPVAKRRRLLDDQDPHDNRPQSNEATAGQNASPPHLTTSLLASSWNIVLLEQWTGTRDRVNRWLLHTLAVDEDQTRLYHKLAEDHMGSKWTLGSDNQRAQWSRLAIRYWSQDDAATGVEVSATLSADLTGNLVPPSLLSSQPSLTDDHFVREEDRS